MRRHFQDVLHAFIRPGLDPQGGHQADLGQGDVVFALDEIGLRLIEVGLRLGDIDLGLQACLVKPLGLFSQLLVLPHRFFLDLHAPAGRQITEIGGAQVQDHLLAGAEIILLQLPLKLARDSVTRLGVLPKS